MKQLKTFVFVAISFTTISNAYDAEEAKEMYQADCTKCHDSSVFTRASEDRKVNDIESLKKQVHRCVGATGASWFEEDEENVVQYLDKTFYKFTTEIKKK